MTKRLASSALLTVVGLMLACAGPAIASIASAAPAASMCTVSNGGLCTFGRWIVYNNTWGPTPGQYVVHAHGPGDWSVTADQNGGGGCGGCAVEAYESAQWNYENRPYSSIRDLWSSFSQTMPTGSLDENKVDAEADYDMFIKGRDTNEVMVWVDNQGQTPAGSRHGVAVIRGQRFALYVDGQVKTFVLERNETSGTVYYFAVLTWLHTHNMLAATDVLKQFNFGWEICDTGGIARTFTVHRLILHQSFS